VNFAALPRKRGRESPLLIDDMTLATIPPDFRDGKVHRAYRISRG
jgi:hypothetical protein